MSDEIFTQHTQTIYFNETYRLATARAVFYRTTQLQDFTANIALIRFTHSPLHSLTASQLHRFTPSHYLTTDLPSKIDSAMRCVMTGLR